MKTYALLICNNQDFLRKKGKVIEAISISHENALDQFFDNYSEELLGMTIMTLCFQDQEQMYGCRYSILKV